MKKVFEKVSKKFQKSFKNVFKKVSEKLKKKFLKSFEKIEKNIFFKVTLDKVKSRLLLASWRPLNALCRSAYCTFAALVAAMRSSLLPNCEDPHAVSL